MSLSMPSKVDRIMITRRNAVGAGIDVGWMLVFPSGDKLELWPVNTRDDESFDALIENAKERYGDFEIEFGHN